MTDKKKEQLIDVIDELIELCQRVAELEKFGNKRKQAKEELKKFTEFMNSIKKMAQKDR